MGYNPFKLQLVKRPSVVKTIVVRKSVKRWFESTHAYHF